MRRMLHWIDLNEARLAGQQPRFPFLEESCPNQALEYRSRPQDQVRRHTLPSLARRLILNFPFLNVVFGIKDLNALLRRELKLKSSRSPSRPRKSSPTPILSKLLQMPRKLSSPNNLPEAVVESCRLGNIFYLVDPGVRRTELNSPSTNQLYDRELRKVLAREEMDWDPYRVVTCWSLINGYAGANVGVDREWFASALIEVMRAVEVASWIELRTCLKFFLCDDEVWEARVAGLAEDMERLIFSGQ